MATMAPSGMVVAPGDGPARDLAPGRRFTLKLQSTETDERVMVFEESAPPGIDTPLHLHRESDEVMYVLSGEVMCRIGDEVAVGGPGTCAFMPRLVPHAWKSTGPEPARLLVLYTPSAAGKQFEELVGLGLSGSGEVRVPSGFVERHDVEIVGPPPF
jgi:mannose-6-phosphate isomerase-like protein (cupin superfamily)